MKRLTVLAALLLPALVSADPGIALTSDVQDRLDRIETIQVTENKQVKDENLPVDADVEAIAAAAEAIEQE